MAMNVFKLRGARAEKGLNQAAMARILGITLNSYSRKERGLSSFSLSDLEKLKKVFGMNKVEEIFFST